MPRMSTIASSANNCGRLRRLDKIPLCPQPRSQVDQFAAAMYTARVQPSATPSACFLGWRSDYDVTLPTFKHFSDNLSPCSGFGFSLAYFAHKLARFHVFRKQTVLTGFSNECKECVSAGATLRPIFRNRRKYLLRMGRGCAVPGFLRFTPSSSDNGG